MKQSYPAPDLNPFYPKARTTILTLGVHESRTQNFIREFQRRGYNVLNFDVTTLGSLLRNVIPFVSACRGSRMILAGTAFPWLVIWILLGRLMGCPVAVDCPMDITCWPFPTKLHWRWLVALTLRAATLVITIRSRSYLAAKFGLSAHKVLFIESCPDEVQVLAGTNANSKLLRSEDDFVICCSGGSPHHRLERFLPIFSALLDLMPNAVLLVISDPAKLIFRLAKTWSKENPKQPSVVCLPVIKPEEDFFATVSACDLWVATLGDDTIQGRFEFRMELLEVGLLKKPVVSARTAGIELHQLRDGEEILFIDPANPQNSAQKIAALAGDGEALKHLGVKLQKHVRERYSLGDAVNRLLEAT